ncbi:MAG TPA: ABC transporter permease [Cyclobacteriaceae bacterium]|nr:ABC transporter permease [Cyclobacteriaceae bacterium]
MKDPGNYHPPAWAKRLIEWYCRPELAEDLLGDLNEYFERNVQSVGVRRAKLIYIIDAVKFLRSYTVRKPQPIFNAIMIGSYVKTSARNLGRNKLFSSINIIGLAISMSVGLLMISFVHDLLSYDRFHKNGDRIYRVLTWPGSDKNWGQFASTSVRAARLIQERVPGIEESTILRQGFGGDAEVGETRLPMDGLWADNSFLKVFTFPLVSGDVTTALKDPYSIVLTETSAKKLFGDKDPLGQAIRFDTVEYQVTGVLKDVPRFSHIGFQALISFSTIEQQKKDDREFNSWQSIWSNYMYLLLPGNADINAIEAHLDEIAKEENAVNNASDYRELDLQRLYDIALGKDLSNSIGPTMPATIVWIVGGLAFIVILSACFNYTNLSIARSIRRFKEVGLRKVIGAGRGQVRQQFLYEAIIVSLLALVISFGIFLLLRDQFMGIAPELQNIVSLDLTPRMVLTFIIFSMLVGVMAGSLPALFFAKVNIITALKDASSVKVFKHVGLRRVLVVVQYTLTLIFITATFIGYSQYKTFLAFDLGFETDNILNVRTQGNNVATLVKEFGELPEVEGLSKSQMVTSVGNYWGGYVKYKIMSDSIMVWYNTVDENYIPLHNHQLLTGQNFIARPAKQDETTEVIINEGLVKKLGMESNEKAIGEELIVDQKKLRVVGVLKDFHYGKVDNKIEPVMFKMWSDEKNGWLNLKVRTDDPVALMTKIEQVWRRVDKIHPMEAKFYKDAIERAYSEFSAMIKLIGFLSFLAISIASMGLFGMVVFTTETRLKEVSIRKVMGASVSNLIVLLGRGFIVMLCVSAAIALPATYFFFDAVVLTKFPYHSPIGVFELFAGVLGVLVIAVVMIGSQTFKAARTNPAQVLKNE